VTTVFECFSTAASCRSFGLGLACGLLVATAAAMVYPSPRAETATAATADAQTPVRAAWHRGVAGADLGAAVRVSMTLLQGARASATSPSPAQLSATTEALLARAEEHRRQREFAEACAAFAELARQGAVTADTWADYADAQAAITGRLAGDPSRAIESALALEPAHPKALWLRASLAHEQHRYADALADWRRLLAVVPQGSSDARVIEANIAEATRLAQG